jgi:hypothetical protein
MKLYLLITMAIMSLPLLSKELSGKYAAVTESHLSLEFDLREDSTVTFTVFSHAEEDGDEDFRHSTDGLWLFKDGKIVISYPNGIENIFQAIDCIPHNEFGAKGCSFGLKLIGGNIKASDELYRYSFWRVETLSKVEY